MAANFSLHGGMILRAVNRLVDQRAETRVQPDADHAVLEHRRHLHTVRLINLSSEGAMVAFDGIPHIGERVLLQVVDRQVVTGFVRWVRDGRIGINFDAPLS